MLKLAQHLRGVDYTDPSLYLQAVYDATKQINARCSYEAFAERLGFGFNTLFASAQKFPWQGWRPRRALPSGATSRRLAGKSDSSRPSMTCG
jgi:hypothetical protein